MPSIVPSIVPPPTCHPWRQGMARCSSFFVSSIVYPPTCHPWWQVVAGDGTLFVIHCVILRAPIVSSVAAGDGTLFVWDYEFAAMDCACFGPR